MINRGIVTPSTQIADLKTGIYDVHREFPTWFISNWSVIYVPKNGTLAGAFALSYADGGSARMWIYGSREATWVSII